MVIEPLTKIMVTGSSLRCKPGSLGYVVCQNQLMGYNLWDRAVLFSKIGKTGKDRLDMMCLSGTMIDYRSLKITPKSVDILKNVTLAEGLHPRLHISDIGKKKPRHGYNIDHTQFDILKGEHKSALNMPIWEFISYITAMSALVYILEHDVVARTLANSTIGNPGDAFYDFPDNIPSISLIWFFFIYGLKLDRQQKNNDCESRWREFFESPEHRVIYITQIRQLLAMMSSRIRRDRSTMRRAESSSRRNIKDVLSYYSSSPGDYKTTAKRSREMVSAGKHPDIDVKEKKARLRRA